MSPNDIQTAEGPAVVLMVDECTELFDTATERSEAFERAVADVLALFAPIETIEEDFV
ncbi:hypothetical protein [Glycomyces paridis]|uniref:hypothetical protein n=1 Tax=Glycomyces paridis TaxID=2126555 RepID=UPI00130539AA|nr:hypothetical protein [Glycomyces paridis]